MNSAYTLTLIIIMGLVTIGLRGLPYLVFARKKNIPKIILYLGDVLPASAIGMLVVYCLKDVNFLVAPYGICEIIAVAFVVLIQVIKRNSILSILVGTISYMFLLNIMG